MHSAYWWTKRKNFGDLLTPLLLERFANLETSWEPPAIADTIAVGSILHHLPHAWNGYVLGAGKLRATDRPHLTHAKVLALRGPLTAEGISGDYVLCDPGLLASRLVQVETKVYGTAVIPHWSDTELEKRREFVASPDSVVVHAWRDPLKVIQMIGESKRVVTSSLHGMIIADSFGIPRRMIYTKEMDRDGGRFKFEDYSASIGLPLEIGKFQLANRDRVADMTNELLDVFEDFGRMVKGD